MLITKEKFEKLITDRLIQSKRLDYLGDCGLDLWDTPVIEYGSCLFDYIIELCFNEIGADYIYGWIYELDDTKDSAETIEDLWDLVEKYRI